MTASPGAFSTLVTATSGGADQTTIRYRLSGPGLVTVTILDGSGTLLRTLVSGASRPAGTYSSGDVWDGTTDSGELVSSCTCRVRVDAVDLLGNPGVGGSALVTIGSAPVTLPDLAPALGAPSPAATPELDSLALFGSGLAGIGGYVLLRLRAGRRRS